jgi:murein DD-endopeptidase MepM/ murein hydrolase activator NlpD
METITVTSSGFLRSPARASGRHRRPSRIRWRRYLFAALLAVVALAATTAAPARSATADEPRFTWPLSPTPAVTRGFEPPADAYGAGHRGVDLAATPGQQVLVAGPGVVVFAGTLAGRGVVSVDHDGGLRTTYEPVTPAVSVGDQVYQGQPLGTVLAGHPGCTVAACLHWGVRRGDEYLNPLAYIATAYALRLKPWDG